MGPGRLCVWVCVWVCNTVYGLYVCACGCARARVRSCAHVQTERVEGLGCHLVCVCRGVQVGDCESELERHGPAGGTARVRTGPGPAGGFKLAIATQFASPNWKDTDAPRGGAGALFGPALAGPARAGLEIQVGNLRF